jgi:ketosteroid isomerase-like protein
MKRTNPTDNRGQPSHIRAIVHDVREMAARDLMRRYIDLARAGDWERAFRFFAEDVVIHIPGRSAHAGEMRGRDAARRYIEAARALSEGHDVEVELIDMLASEERVALIVRERFHRPGGDVEIRRANVYRIEDEHIAEVWIYEHDQYAVDELMAEMRLDD